MASGDHGKDPHIPPGQRPRSVTTAFALWVSAAAVYLILSGVVLALRASVTTESVRQSSALFSTTVTNVGSAFLGYGLAFLVFAFKMRAGRRWARIALIVAGGLGILTNIAMVGSGHIFLLIVGIALIVVSTAGISFMFQADANRYFARAQTQH